MLPSGVGPLGTQLGGTMEAAEGWELFDAASSVAVFPHGSPESEVEPNVRVPHSGASRMAEPPVPVQSRATEPFSGSAPDSVGSSRRLVTEPQLGTVSTANALDSAGHAVHSSYGPDLQSARDAASSPPHTPYASDTSVLHGFDYGVPPLSASPPPPYGEGDVGLQAQEVSQGLPTHTTGAVGAPSIVLQRKIKLL